MSDDALKPHSKNSPVTALFYFTVARFRWLAKVPLLPQLFDSLLLGIVCLAEPELRRAMEQLELSAVQSLNLKERVHRFGGIEFVDRQQREVAHLHGNGLLDVRLSRQSGRKIREHPGLRPHHVFPKGGWISFQLGSCADVPFALELLKAALADQPNSPL